MDYPHVQVCCFYDEDKENTYYLILWPYFDDDFPDFGHVVKCAAKYLPQRTLLWKLAAGYKSESIQI